MVKYLAQQILCHNQEQQSFSPVLKTDLPRNANQRLLEFKSQTRF